MATKKTAAKSTEKKPAGTALVKWEEELARDAAVAAGMEESTSSGQFFSLKGGILSWNEAPLPGNKMAVVILDSILENVYYEGSYDSDNPQGPTCFSFGRDEKVMAPHKIVIENGNSQAGSSGLCSGCDWNEFGSAEKGRGKACKNTRRLGMIPAGTFHPESGKFSIFDNDHWESAVTGFMRLPVTSVKGYAGFVKSVAGSLKRPPYGIVTKVSVVPDAKSQFKVLFEPIMALPDNLREVITRRHDEISSVIDFPYLPFDEDEEKSKPKHNSRAAKAPVKKTSKRKY